MKKLVGQTMVKILVVLLAVVTAKNGNNCPAGCTCRAKRVECSGLKLRAVNVPKIPADTVFLDLSNNKLRNVSFENLQNLKELILDNNPIDKKCHLPPSLKILSLVNCQLSQIVDVGSAKVSIQELNLKNNKFKQIGTLDFSGWSNLENIDFSDNRLTGRPTGRGAKKTDKNLQGIPRTVKNLILDGNRLNALSLGMLENLEKLESLSLRRNKLMEIDPHGLTESHETLKRLDLSNNKLEQLGQFTFKYLSGLVQLDLSNNLLTGKVNSSLPSGSLYIEKTSLERIDLSHNSLNSIYYGLLFKMDSLIHLDLSFNNISEIEIDRDDSNLRASAWKDVRNLQFLDLSNNGLTRIRAESFTPLINLKTLNISTNQIAAIEQKSFKGLNSLTDLNLERNFISNEVEDISDVFSPLKNLEILNLQSNKLRRISKSTFSKCSKLEKLDLRSNPITGIENDSFTDVPTWRELRVNSTQFLCDCNMYWFTNFIQSRAELLSHDDPKCHYPSDLKMTSLVNVDIHQLKCDSNPQLTMVNHPVSKSAQVGSATKFTCTAQTTEIESAQVEWHYQESENTVPKVLKNAPNFVSIETIKPETAQTGNTIQSILTLPTLDKDAIGYYKCSIRNRYDLVRSNLAHLQVHQLPEFTNRLKNQTVVLGAKVKLTCEAKGYPEPVISWTRKNGYNVWVRGRLELSKDFRTLTIKNVNVNDTGKYTCNASNSAGNVTSDVYIEMLPSDKLIEFEPNVRFKVGASAVLKCNYPNIYPPVRVKWYFNNTVLNITDRHFFTEEENMLVIDSVTAKDTGVYQCKIGNKHGSAIGVTKMEIVTEYSDDEMPYWVWIVGVAFSAILVTSLIWLVVFCRTRSRRSNSDLGTEETTLPMPLERHLLDNQKHHQRMAAMSNSRQNDILRCNLSTPMTASSASENDKLLENSVPMFQKPIPDFTGSMYHQLHQPMYGSPYGTPYLPQFNPSPMFLPQNGPKIEMPYRPPFMTAPPTGPSMWTPRPATMPDLDNKYQGTPQSHPHIAPPRFPPMGGIQPTMPHVFPGTPTRSVHNVPQFMNFDFAQTSAPGPDRHRSRKGRRSEPAQSLHQFTPTRNTQRNMTPTVKLKDDEGIVTRVLGPIETTPPTLSKSTQSINKENYKKERRKTEG